MRLLKTLTLIAPLLVLTACVGSTPSIKVTPVAPIHLSAPDSALTKDCAAPVKIDQPTLNQEETEDLWSVDRQSLATCRAGKKAMVKFYHDRDAGLAGSK